MTELELLIAARANIARGHTKSAVARDHRGRAVDSGSPEAVCFCIIGAFRAAEQGEGNNCSIDEIPAVQKFAAHAGIPPFFGSLAMFNDTETTTQAMILEAFDKAIEQCKRETP